MSQLVEGNIPSNTVCPFRVECSSASNGQCHHQGLSHSVPFSCGFARLFEIFKK
jgi:hypothetical protein